MEGVQAGHRQEMIREIKEVPSLRLDTVDTESHPVVGEEDTG
jgi:hypothetical protein